jgi:Protein of unknown function (DUF3987)
VTYDIRTKIPLLEKTKGSGTKYQCPVCNGANLNIQHSSGRYKCYSNECAEADIRKAIDALEGKEPWKPEVQWIKPVRPASRRTFYYPDRDGNSLMKVERVDPGDGGKKDFWQSHTTGGGVWRKGTPEEIRPRIPIYNFAAVQLAIAENEPIWFVEGESTAEALIDKGICATTTIAGSGKLYSYGDYSKDFEGAKIVLCPDRDAAGLKHIAQVGEMLGDKVIGYYLVGSLGLWRNPEGGMDLADELQDHGYTQEELFSRIVSIEEYKSITAPVAKDSAPSVTGGLLSDPLITDLQWREFAEARLVQAAEYDPLDFFPSRLAQMMARDGDRQCVDPVGYIAYLLPAVASLMGHTYLDVGGYTIPNVVWTILVQESGGGKSRIDGLIKKRLVDWEKEEKVLYDQAMATFTANQAMTKGNRNFSEGFSLPPLRRRFIAKDASIATVSSMVCENDQTAFLWTKDEFSGLLKGLNKQSSGDAGDKETLLELWSGAEVIIDRIDKARSMMASSSRVSLVGGMQPGMISSTFSQHDPQGFLARFLLICPSFCPKVAKRSSPELTQELAMLYKFTRGTRGSSWQPIQMADDCWTNCWAPIYDYLATLRSPIPAFQNWLNKSADHVGRVALALHAIECYYDQSKAMFELTEDTLAKAYALILMIMNNVKKVCYALAAAPEEEEQSPLSPVLLRIIKKLESSPNGLQLRDLYQGVRGVSAIAREERTTSAIIAQRCCEELAGKGFINFDGKTATLIKQPSL